MGKINVYLPDDIEGEMRAAGIKPSRLLRKAIIEQLEIGGTGSSSLDEHDRRLGARIRRMVEAGH